MVGLLQLKAISMPDSKGFIEEEMGELSTWLPRHGITDLFGLPGSAIILAHADA